jgi:hypothetical protein
MNYLIAVLPDRIKAEEAYTALEKAGIPKGKMTILGKGYKTADEFGFINPNQQAIKRAIQMSYWLLPFGFVAGYSFNQLTEIELFDWAGAIGNHIIGGIFGAIAAGMGSALVGGGLGLSNESGDDLPYRNRLNAGKYLIVVQYSQEINNKVTEILRQFEPETLQTYLSA